MNSAYQIYDESPDFPNFDLETYKLPTCAKDNRTASGKRKPMTKFIAGSLYSKDLNLSSFVRTARTYYKVSTNSDKNIGCWLLNEITRNTINIDFTNYGGRMRMRKTVQKNGSVYYLNIEIKYPKTNRDLFIKLVSDRYI